MTDSTEFNNIFLQDKAKLGKLVVSPDGLEWRAKSSDPLLLADAASLKRATWTEYGTQASLQLFLRGYSAPDPLGLDLASEKPPKGDRTFHRLADFSSKDEDSVRRLLSRMGVELESEIQDLRGLNCGEFLLDRVRQCVVIKTEAGPAGEIPLTGVSQVAVPSSGEVEIQYQPRLGEDDSDKCELIQVRLHVPPNSDDMDVADMWASSIRGAYDAVEDEKGDSVLCKIPEDIGNFVSPRGKYAIEMHKDFFRMRGKTYDFKVMYSSITQLFLLDKPEITSGDASTRVTKNKFLIISLDNPVRQGQQRYPHLVIQLANESDSISLAMTEEQIEALYGEAGTASLSPEMRGSIPENVAKIFKIFADKKVFVANDQFKSANSEQAVRCNVKTNSGSLFPLKKSLCFLHKPVVFLRYDQIDAVEFSRQSGESRTWDLNIEMKVAGPEYPNRKITFLQIPREEYVSLFKYLSSLNLNIINHKKLQHDLQHSKGKSALPAVGTIMDLGDEDDEDEDEEDSDFGDKSGGKKAGSGSGDEDDDDGSSSSSGSGSDSDMAELVSITSGEVDEEKDVAVEGKRKRGKSGAEDGGEKAKKKPAAKRQKKNPKAPKKGKSSWIFFMEAKRGEVVAENPGFSLGDTSKKLGEMWKSMSAEEKAPFEELAKADKLRYASEMEAFKLTPDYKPPATPKRAKKEKGEKATKAKKSKVDPNKPKKPKSAFLFFGDATRAGLKTVGLAGSEINKKLSEMWKELDDDSKQTFVDQAAEDKKRYDREMRSYVPRDEAGGASSSPDDSSSDDHSDGNGGASAAAAAAASATKRPRLWIWWKAAARTTTTMTTTTMMSEGGSESEKRERLCPSGHAALVLNASDTSYCYSFLVTGSASLLMSSSTESPPSSSLVSFKSSFTISSSLFEDSLSVVKWTSSSFFINSCICFASFTTSSSS